MADKKHSKGQALVEMAFMALVLATFVAFIVNASTAYRTKHVLDQALKVGIQSVAMDTRRLPEDMETGPCPDCKKVDKTVCNNPQDANQDTIGCRAVFRSMEYIENSFLNESDPSLQVVGQFVQIQDPTWVTVNNTIFRLAAQYQIEWMIFGNLTVSAKASSLAESEKYTSTSSDTFTFTWTSTGTSTGTG